MILFGTKAKKYAAELRKHPDFKKVRYLPGLQSPLGEIKPLTPNTKYIVKSRSVKRFFPREPMNTMIPVKLLVEDLITIMQRQGRLLLIQKQKISISLTTGIDSRLTYSMFKEKMEILITLLM